MARPNYSFKKRQKEIKRQKKKEEKLLRRQAKKDGGIEAETGVQDMEDGPEGNGLEVDSNTTAAPEPLDRKTESE